MTAPTPQNPGLANWLLILLLGVIWGSAFMGVSTALGGYGPWTVAAGRVLFGALVLAAIGAATNQPIYRLGSRRAWGFAVYIGIFALALPFSLLSVALQHVPSAFAGVAMGAVPLLILPLVAIFSPEEGIGPRRVAGLVLGFVGLVVLIGPGAFDSKGSDYAIWARLAVFGAAAAYAVGSVVTRRSPKMPAVAFAGASLAAGTCVLVPVALIVEGVPEYSTPVATLGLLYTAAFPTAIATVLRVKVITTAGSMFMSMVSYMVPVWAVLFGIAIMGEDLPPQLFIALGLILAGIGLAQSRAILTAIRARWV